MNSILVTIDADRVLGDSSIRDLLDQAIEEAFDMTGIGPDKKDQYFSFADAVIVNAEITIEVLFPEWLLLLNEDDNGEDIDNGD